MAAHSSTLQPFAKKTHLDQIWANDLVIQGEISRPEVRQLLKNYSHFSQTCALGAQVLYLSSICKKAKNCLYLLLDRGSIDMWDVTSETAALSQLPVVSTSNTKLQQEISRIVAAISSVREMYRHSMPETDTPDCELASYTHEAVLGSVQAVANESITLAKKLTFFLCSDQEVSISSAIRTIARESTASSYAKIAFGTLVRQRDMVTHNTLFAWQAFAALDRFKAVIPPHASVPISSGSLEQVGKRAYTALKRSPHKADVINSVILLYLQRRFGATQDEVYAYVNKHFTHIFKDDPALRVRYAFFKSFLLK